MRIAVMVISFALMLCVGLQSCVVYGLGSIGGNTGRSGGGAVGLLVTFLFLIGAAFVLRFPIVSVICFAVAGFLGLAVGSTSGFSDMSIWGGASLILAGMSFFGYRELEKRNAPVQPPTTPPSRIDSVSTNSSISSSPSIASQNQWSSLMTPQQWIIIGVLATAVIVVFCFIGLWFLPTLPAPQTQVATPRPTPTLAVLNMTLDDIQRCCKDMTTIQEKQYLASLVGSRVNWQGTVDDAKPDGTIWVKISSTRVEMTGAPSEVAAKLSKGQSISFYAIITKAENAFLLPGVQLRFESLK